MRAVAILGDKGGTTKTASTHLLCLGAYLHGVPAAYVLTDPARKVRGEGRPYAVLDGRLPEQLALIFDSSRSNLNGWLFIDGGGNRPDFDVEVARNCDLPVIPFRASEEDIDTVARSLTAIPNAFAWPAAWPTNAFAINAAQYLLDGLAKAFPQRIIHPPIPFVNSISDLLTANLGTPSTAVRQTARKAFATLQEHFELHVPGSDAPEALSA
jgi:chromosome partitioning protein